MTIKNFYVVNALGASPGFWGPMQEPAPGAGNSTYGWTVGTAPLSAPFWRARMGATAVSTVASTTSQIDATSGPQAGTDNTATGAGDSFQTPTPLAGSFVAGNWTLSWGVRSGAASGNGQIRIRCRIWASKNANGSSARLLTASTLVGSTITPTNSITNTSSATWAAPVVTLDNEYLFFQVELNHTVAGTNANFAARFNIPSAFVTTTDWADKPGASAAGFNMAMMGM